MRYKDQDIDGPLRTAMILMIAVLVLSGTCVPALAGETGSLMGVVKLKSRTPVAGVSVVLADSGGTGTEYRTVTDDGGAFLIRQVPPGTYTLRLAAANYPPVEIANLVIKADRTTGTPDIILDINEPHLLKPSSHTMSSMLKQKSRARTFQERPTLNMKNTRITMPKHRKHRLQYFEKNYPYSASGSYGYVYGIVRDYATEEPLSGVNILFTRYSGFKKQSFMGQTNSDGSFFMPYLPVGTYTFSFQQNGYEPINHDEIRIYSEDSIRYDTPMFYDSGFTTTIIVTYLHPYDTDPARSSIKDVYVVNMMKDISTNVVATLQNLPIGSEGRTLESVLKYSTGTAPNVNGPMFLGSSSDENLYILDGMDITDPFHGTLLYTPVFDSIGEISVIKSGADAQYGRALGGIVNVVTRTGTNQFRGSVDVRYTSHELSEKGDHPSFNLYDPDDDSLISTRSELTFGGPILKDRAWFFTAAGLDTDDYRQEPEFIDRKVDTYSLLTKANWTIAAGTTLFGTFTSSRNENADSYLAETYPSNQFTAVAKKKLTPAILHLALDSIQNDTTLHQFQLGYYACRFHRDSLMLDAEPRESPCGIPVAPDLSDFIEFNTKQERLSLAYTFTRVLKEFYGEHRVKAGIDYRDSSWTTNTHYSGDSYQVTWGDQTWDVYGVASSGHYDDCYYEDVDGDGWKEEVCPDQGDYTDYWEEGIGPDGFFHDAEADPHERYFSSGAIGTTKGASWSVFIQDEWRPVINLTIRPGLRYDGASYENDVGDEVVSFGRLQPRIGAAWDLFNDARTIVRSHWGRFMHPGDLYIPYFLSASPTVSGTESSAYAGAYNAGLVGEDGQPDWETYCEFLGFDCDENGFYLSELYTISPHPVDGDLEPPYADEFSLGIQRILLPRVSLELTYVEKRTHDLLQDTCGGYNEDGTFIDPGDSSTWPLDEDGNPEWSMYQCDFWILRNPLLNHRTYRAYMLELSSRYRQNWNFNIRYTYSESKGALQNTELGATDLDIPLHYHHAYGYLPDDRRHRVRLFGAIRFPFNISLGFNFRWESGGAASVYTSDRYYGELDYGNYFLEPRGSRRTPSFYLLDLEIRKTFAPTPHTRAKIFLTAYNLLDNQQNTGTCYFLGGISMAKTGTPEEVIDSAEGSCGYWSYPNLPASWGFDYPWMLPRRWELGIRLEF